MKPIFIIVVLFLGFSVLAQKSAKKLKQVIITQRVDTKKKATQLVLKSVVNDSRCPEGVECIWAGEIELVMSIYKNTKLIKTENVLVSGKDYEKSLAWFEQYYPKNKIKELQVLPYPKEGETHDFKDYYIKISF
jgi:hypothetical protein